MEVIIRIAGLKKMYGKLTAVDDLYFNVFRNEIFGLLGPNGAGKTTTINMICGLLTPSGGKISFEGVQSDKKSAIGYCPQENIFYPKLTCLEQLFFMAEMYGISKKQAKVRALNLLTTLGLETKAHVLAGKLSGGMKRRLNICLALIHNPEILILDEPEAGLDPQSRILVRDFIKAYGKAKTILLTTHNMDEADRLADRIAIMDHGKLLLLDTPQNLKKTVGEGDVLELLLENTDTNAINRLVQNEMLRSMSVKITNSTLLIKHSNIIKYLPDLKDIIDQQGITISEMKLRENTLEDVFIHLTGRNLRQ